MEINQYFNTECNSNQTNTCRQECNQWGITNQECNIKWNHISNMIQTWCILLQIAYASVAAQFHQSLSTRRAWKLNVIIHVVRFVVAGCSQCAAGKHPSTIRLLLNMHEDDNSWFFYEWFFWLYSLLSYHV